MTWYWWLLLSVFAWTFGAYQVGQFRRRVWRKGISTGFWPKFFFPVHALDRQIGQKTRDPICVDCSDDDVSDSCYGWVMVATFWLVLCWTILFWGIVSLYKPIQWFISLPQLLGRKPPVFDVHKARVLINQLYKEHAALEEELLSCAKELEAEPSQEDGNKILERIASLERQQGETQAELDRLKQQLKLNPPAAAYRGKLPAHDPEKN
ncbi:MAG TPA: hypothetical protein VFQ60_03865 [Patescibacteria group bacterium]|nr:hypothetical protein [Patescibacteria group bacterium]